MPSKEVFKAERSKSVDRGGELDAKEKEESLDMGDPSLRQPRTGAARPAAPLPDVAQKSLRNLQVSRLPDGGSLSANEFCPNS